MQEKTGFHLGLFLDKVIPLSVQEQISNISQLCMKPAVWMNQQLSERFKARTRSIFFAPIIEEAVYRLGLQEGIAFAFTQIGFTSETSSSVSILCSSLLFSMGHADDLRTIAFTNVMLIGIIYGYIQDCGSFPEAVLTHILYNKLLWSLEGA